MWLYFCQTPVSVRLRGDLPGPVPGRPTLICVACFLSRAAHGRTLEVRRRKSASPDRTTLPFDGIAAWSQQFPKAFGKYGVSEKFFVDFSG